MVASLIAATAEASLFGASGGKTLAETAFSVRTALDDVDS
jgi:hypothetical protein